MSKIGSIFVVQLHFLQNACFWVRMAPRQGPLWHTDTFLVLEKYDQFVSAEYALSG